MMRALQAPCWIALLGLVCLAAAQRVPAPSWQRDGYVPVPDSLTRPPAPAPKADPNALPPANQWATIDTTKPSFEGDVLGTNVYSDTKYAPQNVQAAIFEAQNPGQKATAEAPVNAEVTAAPAPAPDAMVSASALLGGGDSSLGAGSGAGAGLGGGQGAMLQQGFGPSSIAAASGTDGMSAGAAAGAGVLGGGMAGGAGGMGGAGAAGGAGSSSNDVFTGPTSGFNNKYTPSVGSAIGSSDLIVKMIIEAPEQDAAMGSDAIRSLMGRFSNTPPTRIFVYQTRTLNNPNGMPFTSISFLIKNNADIERSRQQNTFGSLDVMRGFVGDVAKATRLQISPSSIKVSSAVNDGGMAASAGPAAGAGAGAGAGAMPGQMPQGQFGAGQGRMPNGQMAGQFAGMGGMQGQMGAMPGAAAAATPSGVPGIPGVDGARSGASATAAGALTAAGVLLAALAVL